MPGIFGRRRDGHGEAGFYPARPTLTAAYARHTQPPSHILLSPEPSRLSRTARKMYRPDFSTAKDARVVKSREALCRALLDLLETEPFDKISVRQIVDAAGVGYNTFFRHYSDKEAMLRDIAAEEIKQLVSLSVPVLDSKDTLSACFIVCNYVAENKKLWKTLLTGGASGTLREEFVRLSREVAESRYSGKDWLPIDAAVILITSGTFELLAWWLGEEEPVPVDQLAKIYQRVIVSPVIDP